MDIFDGHSWIAGLISWLNESNFFAALFGAAFGTFGAHHLAERAKRKDELIRTIRQINTCSTISFSIANTILGMKKQHVKGMHERFLAERAALEEFHRRRLAGEIGQDVVFNLKVDFRTLSLPLVPIDALQMQIFEKLSLVGRPLALATTLAQTIESLRASMERRNEIIEHWKKQGGIGPAPYFGLRQGDTIDEDYPSSLHAIFRQTDDAIFFSKLLCEDLSEYGEKVRAQCLKEFKKGVPTVSKSDFKKAIEWGLLPDEKHYADWLSSFNIQKTDENDWRDRIVMVLTRCRTKAEEYWNTFLLLFK